MKWTKERPTVEGWYWYRDDNRAAQIVGVGKRAGFMDGKVVELDELSGEWAGPIPPPE